jgi:Transmembrane protein 33/Nucleoporin POM33
MSSPPPRIDYSRSSLYKAEGILKMVFFAASIVGSTLGDVSGITTKSNILILNAILCFAAIKRQLGFPPSPFLNKDYWIRVALNEFTHNLFYTLVLTTFSERITLVFYMPLLLHYLIGIGEFMKLSQIGIFKHEKIEFFFNVVRQNKGSLKVIRLFVEIVIFVYIIVLLVTGHMSLLAPLLCFNYLQIKIKLAQGDWARNQINYKKAIANGTINSWPIPGVLKMTFSKIIELFFKVLTM